MATVTGDIVIDFKVLANINPWVPPASISFLNSTSFQILSGNLKPTSSDAACHLRFNNPQTTGIISCAVEQNHDQNVFSDSANPALLDASGNGYILIVNGNEIRLRVFQAFEILGSHIGAYTATYVSGDIFSLERDLDSVNGDLVAKLNGATIISSQSNAFLTGLAPAYRGVWSNNNSAGAFSIGATGIVSSNIPTINTPDIVTEGEEDKVFTGTNFLATEGTLSLRDKNNIENSITLSPSIWTNTSITSDISIGWLEKLAAGVSVQIYGLPFTSTNYQLESFLTNDETETDVRNLVINPPSGWELYETTIASANTTEGESVLSTAIIQDNMQWLAPSSALALDGVTTVNFTWSSDGTFICDSPELVQINILAFDVETYEISMHPFEIGFEETTALTLTSPNTITEGSAFTIEFTL